MENAANKKLSNQSGGVVVGNNMPFSVEEFRNRFAKVQELIKQKDLVGLLVHSPANIYYLTGYHTSGYFAYQALLVPCEGDPLLLVRELERTNADEYSWLERSQQAIFTDIEDPIDVTARWFSELGWTGSEKPIGFEKTEFFLTIDQYERLRAKVANNSFVDGSDIVGKVRLIKSPQEIEYIRRAAAITDIGMRTGLDALEVGRKECEVAALIHEAQIGAGCEYTSLPHYLSSGYRLRLGHATWTEKIIESGDVLKFELTGCVKRYGAAMMRTAIMGPPSDDVARAADLLIASQDKAFNLMKPGASAGEVDAAVRQPILKAGLREAYHSRVGYSLGIGFPPVSGEWATRDFMAGDTWLLEPGMVFHMIINANGISFSETILVTESAAQRLTSTERCLTVVR